MLQTEFDNVKNSVPSLKDVTLVISDNDRAHAHMNGTVMTISSKHETLPLDAARYLIAHEFGHYIKKHDLLFYVMLGGSFTLGCLFSYFARDYFYFSQDWHYILACAAVFIPLFGLFLFVKFKTLVFEHQADKAGQKLLELTHPGEYRSGMTVVYAKLIASESNEKDAAALKARWEKKQSKLPI